MTRLLTVAQLLILGVWRCKHDSMTHVRICSTSAGAAIERVASRREVNECKVNIGS